MQLNHENMNSNKMVSESLNYKLIMNCISEASRRITPVWDTRDYVAVNPLFGFRDLPFVKAIEYIKNISGQSLLPRNEFYLQKYKSGEIHDFDLEVAINIFQSAYPDYKQNSLSLDHLVSFLSLNETNITTPTIVCISDVFDQINKTQTTELITNEISKWCSAYFDECQSVWKIPSENMSLFSWWKDLAVYDNPFKKQSHKFIEILSRVSNHPQEALIQLSQELIYEIKFKEFNLSNYYYRLLYSVLGWSSYIKKYEFERELRSNKNLKQNNFSIMDILAMRMIYDISLLDIQTKEKFEPQVTPFEGEKALDVIYSNIWLEAAENSYRRSIANLIKFSPKEIQKPDVQMAFCIDVRSEVLRRNIENLNPKIQTLGFAGFFGLPLSYRKLGHQSAEQNCPVLIKPTIEITENVPGNSEEFIQKKRNQAESLHFKKWIPQKANSGFSFVETLGLGYIKKIVDCGIGKTKPNMDLNSLDLPNEELNKIQLNTQDLHLDTKVSLAHGALKNMGLTHSFSKYIFLIGHGSESANNPYAAALDCGACAGHNGQPNAALLANILNEVEVRDSLKKNNIEIPLETVFLYGWHNTTQDKLIIESSVYLNEDQKSELKYFYEIFDKALLNCKRERAQKLPSCSDLSSELLDRELSMKSRDWSEIRPEWGLARNASFIVADRALTRGLNLQGRSFLHEYDPKSDLDLSRLELIMTAPMIVTNWINMQYYASTVNPHKFGAGNKVLNNVVGGVGCIIGNQSDLLTGLNEQSVWYNGKYFHEPIRLQVFIQAEIESIDKIMIKHQMVKDLVANDWLTLISIHPNTKELKVFKNNKWINTQEDIWN